MSFGNIGTRPFPQNAQIAKNGRGTNTQTPPNNFDVAAASPKQPNAPQAVRPGAITPQQVTTLLSTMMQITTHAARLQSAKAPANTRPSASPNFRAGGNTGNIPLNYNDNASLKDMQHRLLGGRSKQLDNLLQVVDTANPESQQADAAKKQIRAIWAKRQEDPTAVTQYMHLQNIRQLNATIGSLKVTQKNLQPNTQESKGISNRLAQLSQIRNAYIQKSKTLRGTA